MNELMMIANEMGVQNPVIPIVLVVFLIIIFIMFFMLISMMKKQKKLIKKYNKFMKGENAESLENEIMDIFQDIQNLKENTEENNKEIQKIYKKMETHYQKIGIIKYDAFHQMGGKLSFVLCLLDENDNGFIMNSVHSTDGCYSYIKEVNDGKCDISLGDEESSVLEIAKEYK